MAWARAIGCKSVYITRYRSMKVPVSFWTLHATADKTILVDSEQRIILSIQNYSRDMVWEANPLKDHERYGILMERPTKQVCSHTV